MELKKNKMYKSCFIFHFVYVLLIRFRSGLDKNLNLAQLYRSLTLFNHEFSLFLISK